MVLVPINPDVQQSYRDTLKIPASPSMIDTDEKIIPVAIIAQASIASTAQFMKITDGTDNMNVNVDGSLTVFDSFPSNATPFNFCTRQAFTANTPITLKTPAGGKKLYITQAILQATAGDIRFGDNVTGNALPSAGTTPDGVLVKFDAGAKIIPFPKPVVCSTNLAIINGTTETGYASFSGYEL
jgi:hypothetical protein